MSKFTKALEKIQNDRAAAGDKHESKKPELVFDAGRESVAEAAPAWLEADIPILKDIQPDLRVVSQRFPNSLISEQYRMLRTSLKNTLGKPTGNVVLVSSSIRGEGKSVTTANLAVSLAETGDTRVAVVDADLRKGMLGEYLGFGNKRKGLSHFLSNGLALKDVMVRNFLDNLVVIPRGEIADKPSELVCSTKFQRMIADLRDHFDYVLIDAPPIMSAADAGIFGREADGVLMVIQLGRTPKSVIAHANTLFKQAGVRMLGYVLTNVEYQSSDYLYIQDDYAYGKEVTKKKKKGSNKLKRASYNLKTMEERFTQWWDTAVAKEPAPQGAAPADGMASRRIDEWQHEKIKKSLGAQEAAVESSRRSGQTSAMRENAPVNPAKLIGWGVAALTAYLVWKSGMLQGVTSWVASWPSAIHHFFTSGQADAAFENISGSIQTFFENLKAEGEKWISQLQFARFGQAFAGLGKWFEEIFSQLTSAVR